MGDNRRRHAHEPTVERGADRGVETPLGSRGGRGAVDVERDTGVNVGIEVELDVDEDRDTDDAITERNPRQGDAPPELDRGR